MRTNVYRVEFLQGLGPQSQTMFRLFLASAADCSDLDRRQVHVVGARPLFDNCLGSPQRESRSPLELQDREPHTSVGWNINQPTAPTIA